MRVSGRNPLNKIDFSQTQVVLYATDIGRRKLAHDVLYSVGLPVASEPQDIEDLSKQLTEAEPDLIVMVLESEDQVLCDIVRDIRHDMIGVNPYVVVMALTWESEQRLVDFAINGGFDDIIVMPVSISALNQRFETMIERRKEFVVTPTYIGPDRRSSSRPSTDELGTFPVPNGLRYKTTGDIEAVPSPLTLQVARRTTACHSLHRIATRVTQLATLLEDAHNGTGSEQDAAIAKQEIDELLDRMDAELDPHDHRHIIQLAALMRDVMEILGGREAPGAKMFELFRLHGMAMTASLISADDAASLVAKALNAATQHVGQIGQRAVG